MSGWKLSAVMWSACAISQLAFAINIPNVVFALAAFNATFCAVLSMVLDGKEVGR